jgi:hypothetical protein
MTTLLSQGDAPCLPNGSAVALAAFMGVLSFDDAAIGTRAIEKLLTQAYTVILDVADLRCQHDSAVTIFSRALLAAGGWPSVRLVVTKPDRRRAAALATARRRWRRSKPDELNVESNRTAIDPESCGAYVLYPRAGLRW